MLLFSVDVEAFVIGLSPISSYFSYTHKRVYEQGLSHIVPMDLFIKLLDLQNGLHKFTEALWLIKSQECCDLQNQIP